ncbi:heparan-alpha-glucosaminide N-acetyltransferase [Methanococcus maripaludis]|uniref:Heparan-alpha-glucosaminide N-acetyltransferase catalytic domain-containing protein n=2 Tax=Methanococcus maripaludis TaxID=39152 RepID=A6VIS8_METM7|nr:heparan-alpha-glucosaminide N-acetyltransferase [Methanococcus maripaludis]MBA2862373.1 putative membrane protein [Methanococcus maripaludis]
MQKNRYLEIDFVRGIAIILMVISNFVTDLKYFLGYSENLLFWSIFALFVASMFIFISGVSFNISFSKKVASNNLNYKNYFIRFTKLFTIAILITIITGSFLTSGTIYFGIIHFLAISGIFGIIFYRFKKMNLFFAFIFLIIGFLFNGNVLDTPYLLIFGIMPRNFYTLDYFPIFPWFGIYLLGMNFSEKYYKNGVSRYSFEIFKNKFFNKICFLGQNTLFIYIIHQPILVGLLILKYGIFSKIAL